MKTTNRRISVKTTCILFVLLTSASLAQAYPPDNAAVLYYKAFLMLKEPSEDVKKVMSEMRQGKTKANDQVRQHLDDNKNVLEFVEDAAEVRHCDWGHDVSRGLGILMPELSKLRLTAFLVCAEAQILSEEGDQKAALEKCVTIHEMSNHVGDELLISYLVSAALRDVANSRIRDFLSAMPADEQTLAWLKSQLIAISLNAPSIQKSMLMEKKISMHAIRNEKIDTLLEAMGDDFVKDEITADAVKKVRAGDAKFFKDNRAYYANVMDDVIAAVDLPYQQSHGKLEELSDRVQKDAKEKPAAIMAALLMPANSRVRTLGIKNETFFNATRAAIEIYIIKAKTGRLPEKLPADLPKDLFSGEDFEYKKTKDGFILRCQGKDLDKDETSQYEFKVAK
ncbi:MAG: hypothetical protein ACYSWO_14675 [Planctomycetota bacterium]|jgi:hypothetical protein